MSEQNILTSIRWMGSLEGRQYIAIPDAWIFFRNYFWNRLIEIINLNGYLTESCQISVSYIILMIVCRRFSWPQPTKGVVIAFKAKKGCSMANCRKSTNRWTKYHLSLIYFNENLASYKNRKWRLTRPIRNVLTKLTKLFFQNELRDDLLTFCPVDFNHK